MAASAFVLQMVRAHYAGDEAVFVAAAQSLARGLKVPRVTAAIHDALKAGRGRANGRPSPKFEPLPLPPTEAGGMLQRLPATTFAELMLDRELQFLLDEFVIELEYRDALAERNLTPRSRVLFHGPPGNGKSSAAAAIAHQLNLPAYGINFGELVSRYVGATSENLTKLFGSLRTDTVVVFDEIDAIGSYRGSAEQAAGKEMNSIVNTLLTLLDRNKRGIIIATTNRPDILDPALLRRFDEQVLFPEPNDDQKQGLSERLCAGYGVDTLDVRHARNFDEVAKVCATYARRLVMRELLAADAGDDEPGEQDGNEEEANVH
jgi:hypothetical protein